MGGEALDFVLRPLYHGLEVDDKLIVDRVVCGAEGVERGCAGTVEDPEHGEMLLSFSGHRSSPCPSSAF
jgi:hypothetical protein